MLLNDLIQKVQTSNPVAGSVYDFSTRRVLTQRDFERNTRGYLIPNKYEDPFLFSIDQLDATNQDLNKAYQAVKLIDTLLEELVASDKFKRLEVKDTQNIVLRLQWLLEARGYDYDEKQYANMFRYASRYISHHMANLKLGFETGVYSPIPLLLTKEVIV